VAAVGVETDDMDRVALVVDDGLQAIAPLCLTATVHLVDPRIQTEVMEQATAMSKTGTHCVLVSTPTIISFVAHSLFYILGYNRYGHSTDFKLYFSCGSCGRWRDTNG
jgi:hypothetical protein